MKEFKEIPGEVITHVIEVVDELKVSADTVLIEKGDPGSAPIFIVIDGKVQVTDEKNEVTEIGKNMIFGDDKLLDSEVFDKEYRTIESTTLLVLRKEELFNLMSMHIEIIDIFIKIINHEFRKEVEEKFDISIFN